MKGVIVHCTFCAKAIRQVVEDPYTSNACDACVSSGPEDVATWRRSRMVQRAQSLIAARALARRSA